MKESAIEATLRIGQRGVTDAVVAEVREQLRRRNVIKVKRLRTTTVEGREKEFWQDLAKRAGARLLEVRGHTAVLASSGHESGRDQQTRRAVSRDEEE